MNEQLMVTIAVGPVLSLIVVTSGYIVQNANLNAFKAKMNTRMAEMNARMAELKTDLRELMSANTATLRAEIARNHSEMLYKFAEFDERVAGSKPSCGGNVAPERPKFGRT